jgi:hypothetical protein
LVMPSRKLPIELRRQIGAWWNHGQKIHPHQVQAWSVKQVYSSEGNDMNSMLGPGNAVLLQSLGPKDC